MKRLLLLSVLLLAAIPVVGAQPHPNWIKVELSWAADRVAPIPTEALAAFGGEDVADYGSFRIVYLPKGLLDAFKQRANADGLRVRERDELDRIDTPSASIDVREGIHRVAPGDLIHSYPSNQTGLYLVQLAGPAKAEWSAALRSLGWTIAGYIPSNAYIIAGRPALVEQTKRLPFVQFSDFYHPFEKANRFARDSEPHDVILELAPVDGRQATIDAISRLSLSAPRVESYSNDVYVHARLKGNDAAALLSDPLVIAIDSEPVIGLSDERVANSLTTNVTANGSAPINPGGYASWLNASCGLCQPLYMPASTWRVGIADTGLDAGSGANATHHPDLAGREFWGGTFVNPNDACGDCDDYGHGTMVAGIIAGNASTGLTDTDGYRDGQGIAPSAGIFSTKIFARANCSCGLPTGNIFDWTSDATSHGTYIQNHSHNDYHRLGAPSTSGLYTMESRQYDQATRDSDNNAANGLTPILLTVSSGNIDQDSSANGSTDRALPPATAKNVISVGGAENYRPAWAGQHPCVGALADDFRNLNPNSARGTTQPGYIKPDLVAPATIVVTTRTTQDPTRARYTDCYDNFDGNWNYTAESGTSFAAPVAAGAAILVKRYLSSLMLSPAATKAFLIANARSIRGGVDHKTGLAIGSLPNVVQGFGRLTLERAFSQPSVTYEESASRHFTTTGQTWRARFTVRDAAKPVAVALVWTDAAGAANVTNPLVNDLDLSIVPNTQTCTYFQGNGIGATDESISYACAQNAPLDSINNVEYARFFVNGYSQFDVVVKAHSISQPADPGYSASNNQDFALVLMNADYFAIPPIPPQLTASRNPTNPYAIDLSWTPPLNLLVDHYTINRGATITSIAPTPYTTTGTTFTDTSLPSSIHTWVYNVTASSPAQTTTTSNTDFATTVQFHDVPVTSSVGIQAQHFAELRLAIDAIRAAGNKSATTWTDSSLSGISVKAAHLTQMRTQLADGLSAFGVVAPTYTYSIFSGQAIHALDVQQMRNNVK